MKKTLLIIINSILFFQLQAQCKNCDSFEEAMIQPKKVKSLKINSHVNGVQVNEIPNEIGKLVNIKVLYLSDLNISSIPFEIKHLKKVREISFAGCKLSSLPDEIYTLKKLREIVLFDNNFSKEETELIKQRFKKESPKTRILIE